MRIFQNALAQSCTFFDKKLFLLYIYSSKPFRTTLSFFHLLFSNSWASRFRFDNGTKFLKYREQSFSCYKSNHCWSNSSFECRITNINPFWTLSQNNITSPPLTLTLTIPVPVPFLSIGKLISSLVYMLFNHVSFVACCAH